MNALQEAISVLKRGGVVAFPTETSYGLAVDATNARAVAKLYRLKGRPKTKSLPLIAASVAMVARYARLGVLERQLVVQFWPGPLTLVLRAKKGRGLARGVVQKDGTVAIRVSAHTVARALSRGLKKPITATSANRSGKPPAFHASEIPEGVDYMLEAGDLRRRKSSTIVRVVGGEIEVLREGSVRLRIPPPTPS